MKLAGGQLTGAPAEVARIGGREESSRPATEAARKRAAVELISRQEGSLRRTARRFSLCADDADDAYQRALEILLTKAPTGDVRELARWMTTVVKHEALKVRQNRERILGSPATSEREDEQDWVALIPSDRDGPAERAERHELITRSREALQALKPQELRALTLLAEGYSYAEIGEITGFSHTKINRCVAEGRERFRSLVSRSEDGRRCEELGPFLSAFCDGEASGKDAAALREHLRACAHCRSTMRAYRAAPRAAAALVPALPVSRSLLERAHEAFASLHSRLPWQGGAGDSLVSQVAAAGGTRGAGMAALAKVLAVCVGTAGGAAACVAAGVVPTPLPLDIGGDHAKRPTIERPLDRRAEAAAFGAKTSDAVSYDPAPPEPAPGPKSDQPAPEPAHSPTPPPPSSVEFTPEAAVPAASAAAVPISSSGGGSASSSHSSAGAGEFGP